MAESFLFSLAESLIKILATQAYEEASRIIGVYDDVQQFKETLSFIKAVLLDAEKKQEHNHELQEWMKQIKRVFSDAESVLDEVECEALRKHVVRAYGSTKTKVGRFFSCSNPLVFRFKLSQRIKELKQRLDRVAADRDKFGLVRIDVDRRVVHKRDMTYSHVADSDVIGREHDKQKIIDLLMQHNSNGADVKNISVIPIVGIGGLGKTTLAKFVFNDKRVTESFSLKMWVCVSFEDFDLRQLLIKIISCADEFAPVEDRVGLWNLKELDMEQLANHLRNKLFGQKYLLVLDDVWNEDYVKWAELRDLIQVGARGSKVLVTTRSHTIASMMRTIDHSHILEGLSFEDSLSLFVKWAFRDGEDEKYPNLVMIGKEIVKKCGGFPLAVRTLGSLLFSKQEIDEWEYVKNNEIWNLPQKKDDILPALKLSYDQMPSSLRRCFATFSLYPKDYEFRGLELTSLWGALGLLPSPNENQTLEDVVNQYLYELNSRSFLQPFLDLGTTYYFRIHDLVHDLALFVAKDECLLVDSSLQKTPHNVQNLSFVEDGMLDKCSSLISARVKTILFPVKGVKASNEALMDTWESNYKFLRYLDLRYSSFETLPRSIGKLKHLRCLDLSGNKRIKKLPDSISKLQNLQSFSIYGCTNLEMLPKGLREMISLRHFEITTKQHVFPQNKIASLSCLQNLDISFCYNVESLFAAIKLPSLRFLRVASCSRLKLLPLDFQHFPQLETLSIDDCDKLELFEGYNNGGILSSKMRLKFISFVALPQMVMLPQWIQASTNTLQSLMIGHCYHLEELPEWFSSLSHLKSLVIIYCPKLVSLPNEFHRLAALESLVIDRCPELCRKCQPLVGEYWDKICHIKQLAISEPE